MKKSDPNKVVRQVRMLNTMEIIRLHKWMEANKDFCITGDKDLVVETAQKEADIRELSPASISNLMKQMGWVEDRTKKPTPEVTREDLLELRKICVIFANRIKGSTNVTVEEKSFLEVFIEKHK